MSKGQGDMATIQFRNREGELSDMVEYNYVHTTQLPTYSYRPIVFTQTGI